MILLFADDIIFRINYNLELRREALESNLNLVE